LRGELALRPVNGARIHRVGVAETHEQRVVAKQKVDHAASERGLAATC